MFKHIPIIVFLFLYVSVMSYKLISKPTPFYDWDESIYVEVGREMVQKGSLTPLWQGKAWLEKPPLAPLTYGIIIQFVPGNPEVTTRLFSLYLAAVAISLVYLWGRKATGSSALGLLAAVITACNPIFVQRAQTVNTDVFLLIGWLGYLFAFPRLLPGLFFLSIGVLSKSLLGFYPAVIMLVYDLYCITFVDRKHKNALMEHIRTIAIQAGLLAVWFIGMTLYYGREFIQVQFIDHMVRRVTSSIESHFGKRTYYIDEVIIQYGFWCIAAIAGIVLVAYRFIKKRVNHTTVLYILFLLPWFLFLNLTKTKISWYLFPAIPQIALLMAYPLSIIPNKKQILYAICIVLSAIIAYRYYKTSDFMNSFYSRYDDTYALSTYAGERCDSIHILVDKDGRNTYSVLKGLGLTISTSTLYGNHPSIVYYAQRPVSYIYEASELKSLVEHPVQGQCAAVMDNDPDAHPMGKRMKLLRRFGSWELYGI